METTNLHPTIKDSLIFWSDRAKTIEHFEKIEKVWALQMLHKYEALRFVGFNRLAAFLMLLKAIK